MLLRPVPSCVQDRRPEGQRLADAVYFEARNQATVSPAVGTAVEARRHALQAVGQARSLVASAGRAAEAARARRAAPELRAFLLCMHRLDKKQHKQLPALPAVAIESICLLVLLQGNV